MALVLLAACTASAPTRRAAGSTLTPTEVPSTTPSQEAPFVRTCQSQVAGYLGEDWRDRSLVIGPIAFVGLPGAATRPRREFAPLADGGFVSVKALVVVDRGAEVTVIIPSLTERAHIALLYDPAAFKDFNSYQLHEGETSVIFHACHKGGSLSSDPTQFNGSFIVDGTQCVTLNVVNGASGLLKRVNIAFGRGTCASSS